MPLQHRLWSVGASPSQVKTDALTDEKALEDMIVTKPGILSDEWMQSRKEDTTFGGRFDLLAIAPHASLVLIELNRDKATRNVIADDRSPARIERTIRYPLIAI